VAALLLPLLPLAVAAQTNQSPGQSPGRSAAQSPDQTRRQLQETERDRAAALAAQQNAAAQAAAEAAAAGRLAEQRAAAETRLKLAQQAAADASARMAQIAASQTAAQAAVADRAAALAPLLPLIERLSRYPAETLLAVPLPPHDAVRGLLVVRAMTHQAALDAAELRRQQTALRASAEAMKQEAPRLAAAQAKQEAAAADLDARLVLANQNRQAAEAESAEDARRAAELGAKAATLHGLLDQLEQAARRRQERATAAAAAAAMPPPASAVVPPLRGSLTTPVAGRIVRGWGEPTEAGPAAGVSYRAIPGARVVAPCAGSVMFAAPFRSYGNLLIIDCGGGYAAVLSGFGRLDTHLGENIRRGATVGTLPTGSRPVLYLELRRDGQPVNPVASVRTAR
jgi:septal ring factor EnvC (AmiA/AmiB activator)